MENIPFKTSYTWWDVEQQIWQVYLDCNNPKTEESLPLPTVKTIEQAVAQLIHNQEVLLKSQKMPGWIQRAKLVGLISLIVGLVGGLVTSVISNARLSLSNPELDPSLPNLTPDVINQIANVTLQELKNILNTTIIDLDSLIFKESYLEAVNQTNSLFYEMYNQVYQNSTNTLQTNTQTNLGLIWGNFAAGAVTSVITFVMGQITLFLTTKKDTVNLNKEKFNQLKTNAETIINELNLKNRVIKQLKELLQIDIKNKYDLNKVGRKINKGTGEDIEANGNNPLTLLLSDQLILALEAQKNSEIYNAINKSLASIRQHKTLRIMLTQLLKLQFKITQNEYYENLASIKKNMFDNASSLILLFVAVIPEFTTTIKINKLAKTPDGYLSHKLIILLSDLDRLMTLYRLYQLFNKLQINQITIEDKKQPLLYVLSLLVIDEDKFAANPLYFQSMAAYLAKSENDATIKDLLNKKYKLAKVTNNKAQVPATITKDVLNSIINMLADKAISSVSPGPSDSSLDSSAKSDKIFNFKQFFNGINTEGDTSTLLDNKDNLKYRYSFLDGARIVQALRKEQLNYKNEQNRKYRMKGGEKYSYHRENRQHIFISDPYFVHNIPTEVEHDINVITANHSGEAANKNNLWSQMPTLLIFPIITLNHWQVIRVEIDYANYQVSILYDDPFGINRFDDTFKKLFYASFQEQVKKLFAMHYDANNNKSIEFIQYDKMLIQQSNGFDCGPTVFSNIADYAKLDISNKDIANSTQQKTNKFTFSYQLAEDDVNQQKMIALRHKHYEYCEHVVKAKNAKSVNVKDNVNKTISCSYQDMQNHIPAPISLEIEKWEPLYIEQLFAEINKLQEKAKVPADNKVEIIQQSVKNIIDQAYKIVTKIRTFDTKAAREKNKTPLRRSLSASKVNFFPSSTTTKANQKNVASEQILDESTERLSLDKGRASKNNQ